MTPEKAFDHISEIRNHISRTEMYRGYSPRLIAVIGIVSLLYTSVESVLFGREHFLLQWLVLGTLILAGVLGRLLFIHSRTGNRFEKIRTRRIVIQFIPFIAAGTVTGALFIASGEHTSLLPGLWLILFSLAIVSMIPFMTVRLAWAALFYGIAGALVTALVLTGHDIRPWGLGVPFGIGHLITAALLNSVMKRGESHEERQ